MLDTSKFSMEIRYAIARNIGLIEMHPDTMVSPDIDAEIAKLTPEAAFIAWCNWKGFRGWGSQFIDVLDTLRAAQVSE